MKLRSHTTLSLRPAHARMPRASTCGFRQDCTRNYTAADIEASASLWDPSSADMWRLRRLRAAAQEACSHSHVALEASTLVGNGSGTMATGGWCLALRQPNQTTIDPHSMVNLPGGHSYYLPAPHVAADSTIVDFLATTLHTCQDPPACRQNSFLSVNDFGAGVGQYGHALLGRDPGYRWLGYDNAGNVEAVTDGFVAFFDLTTPLSLPRADWVMSLEVGEHVPPEHERMLIRNLHAHNCRGILLSWAHLGKWGVGHVNNHRNEYLIALMDELGYAHNAKRTAMLRMHRGRKSIDARNISRPWFWFMYSVFVFERRQPLALPGCSAAPTSSAILNPIV